MRELNRGLPNGSDRSKNQNVSWAFNRPFTHWLQAAVHPALIARLPGRMRGGAIVLLTLSCLTSLFLPPRAARLQSRSSPRPSPLIRPPAPPPNILLRPTPLPTMPLERIRLQLTITPAIRTSITNTISRSKPTRNNIRIILMSRVQTRISSTRIALGRSWRPRVSSALRLVLFPVSCIKIFILMANRGVR